MSRTPQPPWEQWRADRDRRVRRADGPLALTGTHWFDDELELAGVPGRWRRTEDGVRLQARRSDGVSVDGVVLDGESPVATDLAAGAAVVRAGRRRLVLIDRDGALAVRVYDPDAPARSTFAGIVVADPDPSWVLPARVERYDRAREVLVPNADGVHRPLVLHGAVAFDRDGVRHVLQVDVDDDGAMQAVFSDRTSGGTSYRFRFLDLPAPDALGHTVADFTRAVLPPCAFSEHFVCPFPPPGNDLDLAISAGELRVAGH